MAENNLVANSHKNIDVTRQWYYAKTVILSVRLILGAVFIYASLDKLLNTEAFAQVIYNYRILPGTLVNIAAIILPWLEFLAGVCLITGMFIYGASFLVVSLMVTFFTAILFNFTRGIDINCGCFSTNGDGYAGGQMLWYLIRDGIFLLLSIYLFLCTLFKKGYSKNQE